MSRGFKARSCSNPRPSLSITPTRKFCTRISAPRASSTACSRPLSVLKSSVMSFLFTFIAMKFVPMPPWVGSAQRVPSPVGGSTLMTSAPSMPSNAPVHGPAAMMLTSSTRKPASGPHGSCGRECRETVDVIESACIRLKLEQRNLVGHVLKSRLDAHADADLIDRTIEQVGGETRTFVELDLYHCVRHALFEPRRPCFVIDDKVVNEPSPAHARPVEFESEAVRTRGTDRVPDFCTRLAALQFEPPLLERFPVRQLLGIDHRQVASGRFVDSLHRGLHDARRKISDSPRKQPY